MQDRQPNEAAVNEAARRDARRQRWIDRAERMRDAFGLVLILVLLTYVLTSLLGNHSWSAVILCIATSGTSIVALTSSYAEARFARLALWLSALTILLAVIGAASGER